MPDEITFFDENTPKADEKPSIPESGVAAVEQMSPLAEPSKETEAKSEKVEDRVADVLTQVSSTTTPTDDGQLAIDAEAVSKQTDAESQVAELLQMASVKGVPYAVKVARKLGDYYILDKMHDELVEKFYEALKAKGMIEE
jgi:cell pole-organizing protein PopZ